MALNRRRSIGLYFDAPVGFFANQGEFREGDYEAIMNKASCLSLISNTVLVWNTIQIQKIVEGLRLRAPS
jgi:TnpA family transposase